MLNQHASIGRQATASTSNVSINLKDFLNAAGNHQRRSNSLLNGKQDTVLGLDTNRSGSELV
jgi:hypothetical protein